MTSETKARLINQYDRGLIVTCPDCRKIDINPVTHVPTCDPEHEEYRREQQAQDLS